MPEDPQLDYKGFAAKVKAKHPEYAQVDDAELTSRILKTYPQYKSNIAFQSIGANPVETITKAAKEAGLRVTSTSRTPEQQASLRAQGRTKAVNSYHLSGRAIDIGGDDKQKLERFYHQINAQYGGHLAESLWEGDHAHFAWKGHVQPQAMATQHALTGRQAAQPKISKLQGVTATAEGKPEEKGFWASLVSNIAPFTSLSGAKEFIKAVVNTGAMMNPVTGAATGAMQHVRGESNFLTPHVDELVKAQEAWENAGKPKNILDYSKVVGHLAAAGVPLFGPAAAQAGEQFGRGNIRGGLGSTVGLLATAGVGGELTGRATKALTKGPRLKPVPTEAHTTAMTPEQTFPASGAFEHGPTVTEGPTKVPTTKDMPMGRGIVKAGESGRASEFRQGYGQQNLIVSPDEARALAAGVKERLVTERGGGGPSSKTLADMVKLGVYHLEAGSRAFPEWSKVMLKEAGAEAKPHLRDIYKQAQARALKPPKELSASVSSKMSPSALKARQGQGAVPTRQLPQGFQVAQAAGHAPPANPTPALPPPGGPSRGMSPAGRLVAEIRSGDKVMRQFPETAPIADTLIRAADEKGAWIGTTERQMAGALKGLSRKQYFEVGQILDGQQGQFSPEAQQAATAIRPILNGIWQQARMNVPMGRITQYLPHVERALGSVPDLAQGVSQIASYHLKGQGISEAFKEWFTKEDLSGKAGRDIIDTVNKPGSRFTKRRTGATNPIEYDVRRILPAYAESMARVIFDRPAVEAARSTIKTLADRTPTGEPVRLREFAEQYIRNYSRFDAYPGMEKDWNRLAGMISRTTGRSMVGLYPGLQMLHLARIPNLWVRMSQEAGLGTFGAEKYFAKGMAQTIKSPIKSFREVTRLGMMPQELRPGLFRRPMNKLDNVLQMFSFADFLDRSIGYYGYKQMAIDRGMAPHEAQMFAIEKSKDASLFIDPARSVGAYMEGGVYGNPWVRLAGQFKHQPAKLLEQYALMATQAKQNPAAFAKGVAVVTGLIAINQATGVKLWHLGPHNMFTLKGALGGPSAEVVDRIMKKISKGDVEGAMAETLEWVTPGGYAIRRGPETLFGALEKEPKKKGER